MYKLITSCPADEVWVDHGVLYLRDYKRDSAVFSHSLEERVEQVIPFAHSELSWWIYLRQGLWFVHYDEDSEYKTIVNVFSIDGELKQTITNVNNSFYTARAGRWLYLINESQLRYDLSAHECQDLGPFPLEGVFFHEGSHRGLHFFTCEGQSQLVAMRDKDGQGLEEVYRLDFSESGRGYSLWYNGVVPGEIDFINFYGSDLWVTTQEHLHRIDVATGKVLERKDEALPKMFIKGSLGYSLFNSYYTVFDFEAGRMLCNVRRDRFVYEGKEYSAEYTSLLLHEGIFYVSVRVSGIFFLAAFDVQTEEFVWHDLWGGWDIDSVHIVDDRMIAHAYDEVRIYQRVSPATGSSGDDSEQEGQVGLQWSQGKP
ncbi:hypothetical protein [uncultured Porphyromonas sp.]|uniref:hypothetical protein n=1 Tax=uncultured Porphyromonas sp. TaxID=159274 RepID=UPI0026214141|nr:hypothetical protein [uncultured Porphyromonas sp.]